MSPVTYHSVNANSEMGYSVFSPYGRWLHSMLLMVVGALNITALWC